MRHGDNPSAATVLDPTRGELRGYPVPEEIYPVESDDRLDFDTGFDIRPMPGGCMINLGPRNRYY